MGSKYRKFNIFFLFGILVFTFLLKGEETSPESMESFFVDSEIFAKGGGSFSSSFSQFVYNPAAGAFYKRYSIGGTYFYSDSPGGFSVAATDSKSSDLAGGILYQRYNETNVIKVNFAFPVAQYLYIGLNGKYNSCFREITQTKKLQSYNFDAGLMLKTNYIAIGISGIDLFAFAGDDLAEKINTHAELILLEGKILINAGTLIYIERDKWFLDSHREVMGGTDIYGGISFNYSLFSLSAGYYNSAEASDLSFGNSMKTFGLALRKNGLGSISFGGGFSNKDFTFNITAMFDVF